jgi:phosphatidate cytidylyltransferase
MLGQRVATAAVGIPIILAVVFIGGILYVLVAAALLTVAALEFFAASDPEAHIEAPGASAPARRSMFNPRLPAIVAVCGIALMALAASEGLDYLTGAFVLSIAAVFLALVLKSDAETGLRDWTWTIAGIAYVGLLGAHLVLLRDFPEGEDWLFFALFATFATDTFAYFTGKLWGRTRIAPRISPGKTLEGTIGGYAAGFVAVFVLEWVTEADMTLAETFLLAWVLPGVAMLGDLAESLIKRGAGVKDASELVPGHGGLLDRMDSLLFTVPLVYYFALWIVY